MYTSAGRQNRAKRKIRLPPKRVTDRQQALRTENENTKDMPPIKIYKFGGASVRSAEGVENLARIVAADPARLLVIVSAMGKTTNALEEVLDRIQQLKCRFSPRYCFVDGDPMHLTIDAAAGGFHGLELAAYLEQHEVFVEYADAFHVVLLCSAANTDRDFDILEQLLDHQQSHRKAELESRQCLRDSGGGTGSAGDRAYRGEQRTDLCRGESALSAGSAHCA